MNKSIFENFELKNLKLKNKIVMAPMCMYAAKEDGFVTDFHHIHYATRAIGGVGTIIVEATGITPNGRISENDLGIWNDDHIKGLSTIVDSIKKYNVVAGIQLNHAGRKCTVENEDIIAPSAIAFDEKSKTPKEMTKEDLENVKIAFKDAAKRALLAGFDFIEIHAAHGYLLSEFLSPLSNTRTDEYGGSLENRTKFVVEVIKEIKKVWPSDKVLGIRVSAIDYIDGGNTEIEMAKMINIIKMEGIDFVNVSTGAVVQAKINAYTGYQIPAAQYIKNNCDITTIGGGLITTANEATEIIENNRCDLVFLGRVLLKNPYWILTEATRLGIELDYLPSSYERGFIN
ncbi:MAG: NADPH dehydrogenase NamA [Sarcina sp.]